MVTLPRFLLIILFFSKSKYSLFCRLNHLTRRSKSSTKSIIKLWIITKFLSLLERYFNEQTRLLTNKFLCSSTRHEKLSSWQRCCCCSNNLMTAGCHFFVICPITRSRCASQKGHFLLKSHDFFSQ